MKVKVLEEMLRRIVKQEVAKAVKKVNGKIVEHTRTTHDKTIPDFFR